ncbi:transposable element Tcb2 transposase [Trichonephila clavipes]|nr:transposable element Tcb2 transposase [Trichonephila clavipes]
MQNNINVQFDCALCTAGSARLTSFFKDYKTVRNARVQSTASSAVIQAQIAPSLGTLCLLKPYKGTWLKVIINCDTHYVLLPLTPTHRQLHLEWCRTRGNLTTAECNHFVFSDESQIQSLIDNRVACVMTYVWLPRYCLSACVAVTHTAPTAGVMVIRAHSAWQHTVPSIGPVARQKPIGMYPAHDILQLMCCHSCSEAPQGIFQQDKAPVHTA